MTDTQPPGASSSPLGMGPYPEMTTDREVLPCRPPGEGGEGRHRGPGGRGTRAALRSRGSWGLASPTREDRRGAGSMGVSWVPGAGAVGPGPSVCPEQTMEGPRPDCGGGVPSAPRPIVAETRVGQTLTPKRSSLGLGSSLSLSPVGLHLQVPMRPWQASARVCVLQPAPGRAHCSRPEEKAWGPMARTEGPGPRTPGPHGRPGTPGLHGRPSSCGRAGLLPGLRADSRGAGAWQGHPAPSGESGNHRRGWGFIAPLFRVSHLVFQKEQSLITSDWLAQTPRTPTNTPHVQLQVYVHMKISTEPH